MSVKGLGKLFCLVGVGICRVWVEGFEHGHDGFLDYGVGVGCVNVVAFDDLFGIAQFVLCRKVACVGCQVAKAEEDEECSECCCDFFISRLC